MDEALRAYADSIDPAHRPLFDRFHALVTEVAPEAAQGVAYGIAAYKAGKRRLYVGAWKHGLSIYGWSGDSDGGFLERHPGLKSGRGTLRLRPADADAIGDDEFRALIRAALVD
jgi:hypothetical protein